jgi:hypothetical protein
LRPRLCFRLLQIFCLFVAASAAVAENRHTIVISVPEQRLYVFNPAGEEVTHYSISTSRFGTGDSFGSFATPLGQLEVASKHGSGALAGTVFKSLHATGEICCTNARGRDPIVTRILWLRGLEKQNAGAYARHIYIHGTPDEMHIGRKASYGCIRMRSRDIIALYETVQLGTRVEITDERVNGLFSFSKATRPPPVVAGGPATTTPTPGKAKAGDAANSKSATAAAAVTTSPAASSSKSASASGAAAPKTASTKNATASTKETPASNETASAKSAGSSKSKTASTDSDIGEKPVKLSLDEPLIGKASGPAAGSDSSKSGSSKKKGVAAVSLRKSRS